MSERNPDGSRRIPVSVFLTVSSAVFAVFVAVFSILLDKEWDTFKGFLLPYLGIEVKEVKTTPPDLTEDISRKNLQEYPDDNGKIQIDLKDVEGSYPQASTRLLTHDDLASMSSRELKIMRNEIFARYGYIFKTTAMKNHFSSQSWYQPQSYDVLHLLTPVERKNIKLIQQYESMIKEETIPVQQQEFDRHDVEGSYPQATTRLLTHDELASMSTQELKIMRNEIFARHGYIFKTTALKNHFKNQSWYQSRFNDVTHLLTSIEQKNIKLIKQYEK